MLKRVALFSSKKEFFTFLVICLALFSMSFLYQYYKLSQLQKHKTTLVEATVLNQYFKHTPHKTYQVLKLKTTDGHTFYTTASKYFKNIKGKEVIVKLWMQHITFLEYLSRFYAKSRFVKIFSNKTLFSSLSKSIASQHTDKTLATIYQALFLATPLTHTLYERFSALGISHLFAISGFHLGILSGVIYLILSFLYIPIQKHFFPHRNKMIDIFVLTSIILFAYMSFLHYPPSLVRAFMLMIVGFVLYQRGFKVISLQTLFVAVIFIIILAPQLLFSIGFWLSVLGVFYIVLFFVHYPALSWKAQLFLVPLWVYAMMLPLTLYIFGNFSLWHPFSILISILFTVFYPLVLFLHLIGFGNLLDSFLSTLTTTPLQTLHVELPFWVVSLFLIFSFGTIFSKKIHYILIALSTTIFFYALFYEDFYLFAL
jgi:competence protein ComEC